jgi:hypothetical protein
MDQLDHSNEKAAADESEENESPVPGLLVAALGFVIMVVTVWAIWLDGRPFDELTRQVAWSAPLSLGAFLFFGGYLWALPRMLV